MIRFVVVACSLLIALPAALLGQQGSLDLGRWKSFTNMSVIRGIAAAPDSIWAATSGGLFLYIPSANRFIKYTNSDGLSSNDLTAVLVDGAGMTWVGSSDGFVDYLDPKTGVWNEITDIYDSGRIQKAIRTFSVLGDSLFIGTDFGITVFQISRREFRDTYANMGFASQAGVNDVKIYRNRIWAATDLGVASAPLNVPNLSAPGSWTRYTIGDGLPAGVCTSVSNLHDTVIVAASGGAAALIGQKFVILDAYNGKSIVDLAARANDVIVLWNDANGLGLGSISGVFQPATLLATNTQILGNALAIQPLTSTPWVGTRTSGIASWTGTWTYKVPNGPQSNLFSSVVVDDRGILWAASGISGRGTGFYRYDPSLPDGQQWKNYTVTDHPIMVTNDYYKVSLGVNGSLWVSSWGNGVIEVVGDSIRRKLDQTTVPTFAGSVPQDTNYVVIGGVGVDSQNNTWFVNYAAVNGNHLVELKANSSVVYRRSISPDGLLTNILIDHNDTKWLANSVPTIKPSTGLFFFNEDSSVAGTSAQGGWGTMTSGDGLPSDIILSLALDLDGDVCVGTDLGMRIITNPLTPKSGDLPAYPLLGQSVQTIAVDAVNNKWVGTKEGVIVANSDATAVVAQYSVATTNGKLVDDDIRSITFDQKRGIAYFATEKGLSSLEVVPVQTVENSTSIELGPNPFLVPASTPLQIRNLAAESTIKIITQAGTLVSEFRAQGGGRAFWDGRNSRGEIVPSGIYFVVAYSVNGSQTATGKIAVVRR